jgi:hypothetical protein
MKKIIALMTIGLVASVVAVAFPGAASSDDLIGPIELKVTLHNGECHFTANDSVTCTGELSGLGSGDVTVVLSATRTCTTSSDSNNPPGQERLSASQDFQVKNGKAAYSVTLGPSCPDKMTTTWSAATISAYQNGALVFGPQPQTIS